jgi:NTP pyrophosphatase (non-canonical NTP hydrolase)
VSNTLNQYQDLARKTAIYPGKGELMGLLYVALGLGEAGEYQGKVKKVLRGDKTLEEAREALLDELGDILWYVSQNASELDITLHDLARRNIDKLRARKAAGTLQGEGDQR